MKTAATIVVFLLAFVFDLFMYPHINVALFMDRTLSPIEAGLLIQVLPAVHWVPAVWLMLSIGCRVKWRVFFIGGGVLLLWKAYYFSWSLGLNSYYSLYDVWKVFGDLLVVVVVYFCIGAVFWRLSAGRSDLPQETTQGGIHG